MKIADFGFAEIKTALSVYPTTFKGTCMYCPPEFASETQVLRHASFSDVYSMGASLSELFSGQHFWSNGDKPKEDCQVMNSFFRLYFNVDIRHQFAMYSMYYIVCGAIYEQ